MDSTDLYVKNLKAIIFDFDGTLVDSEPVWKQSFFKIFKTEHSIEVSKDLLWRNTGNGILRTVTNISNEYKLNLTSVEIKETSEKVNDKSHRIILEETPLREGALEVMKWASQKDIKMAICSASNYEMINTFVRTRELSLFISEIISTVDLPSEHQKPSPEPYIKALNTLNVKAKNALVVEDSPAGIISSVAAGIFTMALEPVELIAEKVFAAKPTVLVSGFPEILRLLSYEKK